MKTENLTKEEQLADDLLEKVTAIIAANKPEDMTTEHILQTMGVMTSIIGVTRTRVLGAAVYFAFYAQIVGLDADNVMAIINESMAAVKADPRTAEFAADYAVKNAQAKQQAAMTKAADTGGAFNPAFMVPGDKTKVH